MHRYVFREIVFAAAYLSFGCNPDVHVGGGFFYGRHTKHGAEFAFYLLQLAIPANVRFKD